MTTVGLDRHKRYITACALDAEGRMIAERRRLRPELADLTTWLAGLPGPVTIAMEATLYWAWIEPHLTALGYTVQVAHAHQVKLIWQAPPTRPSPHQCRSASCPRRWGRTARPCEIRALRALRRRPRQLFGLSDR